MLYMIGSCPRKIYYSYFLWCYGPKNRHFLGAEIMAKSYNFATYIYFFFKNELPTPLFHYLGPKIEFLGVHAHLVLS